MSPEQDEDNSKSGNHPTREMATPDHTVMVHVPRELGCYRLTKILGRGGMGEVWQAFDTHLERDVAIKLMRKELLANEDATRRFAREARAVARLNHPNIVQVYAFGDEQGLTYFVMEMVDGETVAQCLKRKKQIPLDDAIHIMLQAIEGLSYANARGIIHRDIKPSNLMITEDSRVKIADFGLAKMVEHDSQMTAAGTAMGSPNYMSPEQARGEEADHRSDIYALGVSLYQMLCGELPFTASSPVSVLLKQIQDPLPEPECLKILGSGALLDVLKKMTAKAPEDRYQTYGDLANALAGLEPNMRFKGAHLPTSSMPAATPPYTPSLVEGSPSEGHAAAPEPPPPPPAALAPVATPSGGGTAVVSSRQTATPLPASMEPKRSKLISYGLMGLAAVVLAAVAAFAIIPLMNNDGEPEDQAATSPASAPPDASSEPALATPAASPAAAPLTPAAATPSPTQPATNIVASPTPGEMQEVDVSANLLPRPTPLPGQPTSFTPTPSIAQLAPSSGQLVLAKSGGEANAAVPLFDASGAQIASLPSGSPASSIRPARLRGESWYVIRHNNGEAFVKAEDAQPVESAGAPVATPAATPAARIYVLGIAGAPADQAIPTYLDNRGRSEYKRYPPGTEVTVIETGITMTKVMSPDSRAVYIYTKMASPKQ